VSESARWFVADLLFWLGNKFVIASAHLMGYEDTVKKLKKSQADWFAAGAFKLNCNHRGQKNKGR